VGETSQRFFQSEHIVRLWINGHRGLLQIHTSWRHPL
jgi:hypothetical protein